MKWNNIIKVYFLVMLIMFLFSGCSDNINNNGNCSSNKSYKVLWVNYNGETLEEDKNVFVGSIPEYNGDIPVRETDGVYIYEFDDWFPKVVPVEKDIVYTAQFVKNEIKLSVESSHESGFYSDAFYLSFSTMPDADVYYTTDLSMPTKDSIKYTEPILIEDISEQENHYSNIEGISSCDVFMPLWTVDKAVVIRAVAIDKTTNVASEEICKTYFVDYENKIGYKDLPIVSLVMEYDDLFDYETGIYVTGKTYDENDHVGYPETYPANYQEKGKEWERPANLFYFDDEKSFSFNQKIGVRIHGGWSRSFNQKSFNLYARKEYSGTKTFKKPFFDTENLQTCMLRSGGYRDTFLTKSRDSLVQDLSNNESFSVQNSFPCILFLNGEYWGIYNLQERFTEYYVEEHYGVDKDNVIIVENDEIDEGEDLDIEMYNGLKNFFISNSFESSKKYDEAKNYIDIKGFIEYVATELYVGNIDWPGNNVRMWRAREVSDKKYEDGKWRFMMYDTDDSSNIHSKCNVNSDPFENISHWKYGPLDNRCIVGLLMSKLIENDEFKDMFVDTFKRIGSENFSPYKVQKYLEERRLLFKTPMTLYYKRFVSNDSEYYNENYFIEEIDKIMEFFNKRYFYAITFLQENIV